MEGVVISGFNRINSYVERLRPQSKIEWAVLGTACLSTISAVGLTLSRAFSAAGTEQNARFEQLLYASWASAITAGSGYVGHKLGRSPVDYNKVSSIYRPTQAKLKLENYQDKISSLKKDFHILGVTSVPKKDGSGDVAIYIKVDTSDRNKIVFQARSLETDRPVGFALVEPCLASNEYQKEQCLFMVPTEFEGYGPESGNIDKVYIEQVENLERNTLRHVGYVLMKAVFQYYKDTCQGRVDLKAVRNTHPLYYKLGFRVSDPSKQHLNAVYAKKAESGKIGNEDDGYCFMYLPADARALWNQEVAAHPIGFPKR